MTQTNERAGVCGHCGGSREVEVLACPGGNLILVKCSHCDGQGVITEEQIQRFALGNVIREYRDTLDLSCREYAKRLGISAPKLSDMERGRFDDRATD